MSFDLTTAVAVLMIKAIQDGATDRDAIALHVRERLDPLTVTDDHLWDAAERICTILREECAA